MSDRMDENQVRRYVDAFADGELDVEQSLRVLERMAMDPRTTKRVLHQQQLRQRTAHAMEQPTEAPGELRDRVEQLAATVPGDDAGRSVLAQLQRWVPLTAAAIVLLIASLMIGLSWQGDSIFDSTSPVVLTGAQVNEFTVRHVRCPRHVDDPATELFPATLSALTPAMAQYFDQSVQTPPLDLSALGFKFTRAEECHALGAGAVHLMYERQTGEGEVSALSVWMRPFDGDRDMRPGRLYVAAEAGAAHPMVLWHHKGMLYCVMGDSMDAVKAAGQHLRSGPGGPCDF